MDFPESRKSHLLGSVSMTREPADSRALRLRFNLPISMPAASVNVTPLVATETKPSKTAGMAALGRRRQLPTLDFDPLVVAKRSEGWDSMLKAVLVNWVTEAAREVKGERGDERGLAQVVETGIESTPGTE